MSSNKNDNNSSGIEQTMKESRSTVNKEECNKDLLTSEGDSDPVDTTSTERMSEIEDNISNKFQMQSVPMKKATKSTSSEYSEDSEPDSDTDTNSSDSSECETRKTGKESSNCNSNFPTIIKKVDKLQITLPLLTDASSNKSTTKSQVILNKQTDSLKNLLVYDDSSDDSDCGKLQIPDLTCLSSSEDSSSESELSCNSENEVSNVTYSKNEGTVSKRYKAVNTDPFEHEYIPPLPDLSQLKIDVDKEEFLHVGFIASIIGKLVTIETVKGTPTFDLDSCLFFEKVGKVPLGTIFDVLGPVSAPIYVIRFNSTDDIADIGIKKGMKVFAAHKSEYSKYVFVKQLMSIRGSDASWKGDHEVPPEMVEFSDDDDEQEQTQDKRNLKRKHSNGEQHKEFEQIMNQCNVINTRACHLADLNHQNNHRFRRESPSTQTFPVQSQNLQYPPAFNPAVPPPGFLPVGSFQRYPVRPAIQPTQNWGFGYGYNIPPVFPGTSSNNRSYEKYWGPGPSSQY